MSELNSANEYNSYIRVSQTMSGISAPDSANGYSYTIHIVHIPFFCSFRIFTLHYKIAFTLPLDTSQILFAHSACTAQMLFNSPPNTTRISSPHHSVTVWAPFRHSYHIDWMPFRHRHDTTWTLFRHHSTTTWIPFRPPLSIAKIPLSHLSDIFPPRFECHSATILTPLEYRTDTCQTHLRHYLNTLSTP